MSTSLNNFCVNNISYTKLHFLKNRKTYDKDYKSHSSRRNLSLRVNTVSKILPHFYLTHVD